MCLFVTMYLMHQTYSIKILVWIINHGYVSFFIPFRHNLNMAGYAGDSVALEEGQSHLVFIVSPSLFSVVELLSELCNLLE